MRAVFLDVSVSFLLGLFDVSVVEVLLGLESKASANETAEPALIPSVPTDLYAQIPRSWMGSPKTTTTLDAVERFLDTRTGTRGSDGPAERGRWRVVRPREWRRVETICLTHSGL